MLVFLQQAHATCPPRTLRANSRANSPTQRTMSSSSQPIELSDTEEDAKLVVTKFAMRSPGLPTTLHSVEVVALHICFQVHDGDAARYAVQDV